MRLWSLALWTPKTSSLCITLATWCNTVRGWVGSHIRSVTLESLGPGIVAGVFTAFREMLLRPSAFALAGVFFSPLGPSLILYRWHLYKTFAAALSKYPFLLPIPAFIQQCFLEVFSFPHTLLFYTVAQHSVVWVDPSLSIPCLISGRFGDRWFFTSTNGHIFLFMCYFLTLIPESTYRLSVYYTQLQ